MTTKPTPLPGDLINVEHFYAYEGHEMLTGWTGSKNMHGLAGRHKFGVLIQTIFVQNRTYYLVILMGGKIVYAGLQGWIPEIIAR